MTRRHIHYEAAFEDYLRSEGIAYVAVDEQEKAIFSGARVKSFDFLLYRKGFRSLDRIVFDGPGPLEERLERAVTDEPWRRALVTELREPVLEHFTYATVIPPIIELVRQGLGQGAAVSAGRA